MKFNLRLLSTSALVASISLTSLMNVPAFADLRSELDDMRGSGVVGRRVVQLKQVRQAQEDLAVSAEWDLVSSKISIDQVDEYLAAQTVQTKAWEDVGGEGTLHPDAEGVWKQKAARAAKGIAIFAAETALAGATGGVSNVVLAVAADPLQKWVRQAGGYIVPFGEGLVVRAVRGVVANVAAGEATRHMGALAGAMDSALDQGVRKAGTAAVQSAIKVRDNGVSLDEVMEQRRQEGIRHELAGLQASQIVSKALADQAVHLSDDDLQLSEKDIVQYKKALADQDAAVAASQARSLPWYKRAWNKLTSIDVRAVLATAGSRFVTNTILGAAASKVESVGGKVAGYIVSKVAGQGRIASVTETVTKGTIARHMGKIATKLDEKAGPIARAAYAAVSTAASTVWDGVKSAASSVKSAISNWWNRPAAGQPSKPKTRVSL